MINSIASIIIRNTIKIILIILPVISLAQKNGEYYFDEFNNSISKSKFKKKIDYDKNLDIKYMQTDSIINRLVIREEEGKIAMKDLKILRKYLENCTQNTFSGDAIIVVKYYPGKDANNSSGLGNAVESYIKANHKKLKTSLLKLGNVKLVYLYKTYEGLEIQEGIVPWHPDLDRGIEELFFKYHYPGQSFVVINSTGDYFAYFGEHPKEMIIDVVKIFKRKNENGSD